MNPDINIYVITHKRFDDSLFKNKKIYSALLVGKALGNSGKEYYLNDALGENISFKNKSYCELTGLYWMWKNSDSKILGLEHYRRYFVNNSKDKQLLTKTQIVNDLASYDIILPKKDPLIFMGKTADQYFGDVHDPLVWTLTRNIIEKDFPQYLSDFDWYSTQYTGYSYNMMIASKEIVDEYCKWLFKILESLEKIVDLKKYNNYNQRMFGFVSERLLNIWIKHNNLKVKEYPVWKNDKENYSDILKSKFFRLYAKHRLSKNLNRN